MGDERGFIFLKNTSIGTTKNTAFQLGFCEAYKSSHVIFQTNLIQEPLSEIELLKLKRKITNENKEA